MPYASEADYRAAVRSYRALHEVFYRFYRSVRSQQPGPGTEGARCHAGPDAIAADERDYGAIVGELLPHLTRSYSGPRHFVDRLAETFATLGEKHALIRHAAFDMHLVHQAYVDVDNILQDLLQQREHYPRVFDAAFSGIEIDGPDGLASTDHR